MGFLRRSRQSAIANFQSPASIAPPVRVGSTFPLTHRVDEQSRKVRKVPPLGLDRPHLRVEDDVLEGGARQGTRSQRRHEAVQAEVTCTGNDVIAGSVCVAAENEDHVIAEIEFFHRFHVLRTHTHTHARAQLA